MFSYDHWAGIELDPMIGEYVFVNPTPETPRHD